MDDDRARRDAFLRKLTGSSRPPQRSSTPPPMPRVPAPPAVPAQPSMPSDTWRPALTDAEARRAAEEAIFMGHIEEAQGHWANAAALFARAFDAHPSAMAAAHAADDLRRAQLDLYKAARFGEYAVSAEPSRADYHMVLGLVYRDAGLKLRAKSELERALKLDPRNPHCKRLLADLDRL
jgi:tetratricopeptide (TPR) repeat protein